MSACFEEWLSWLFPLFWRDILCVPCVLSRARLTGPTSFDKAKIISRQRVSALAMSFGSLVLSRNRKTNFPRFHSEHLEFFQSPVFFHVTLSA